MKKNLFLAFAIILFAGACFGAWTRDWDETTPTNSTMANLIDDYIRNLRTDVRERLAVDHDFPSDDTSTDAYHKKVTLKAVSEPTEAASTAILYGKDHDAGDGSECMLFIIDEGANTAQLTVQSAAGDAVYLNGAVLNPLSVDVDTIANTTITIAKMAAAAIVTEAEGVGDVDDDTAVPTDGAVKAYVDDNVGAANMKADNVAGATFGVGNESVTLANGMIIKAGYQADAGAITTVTFGDAFPGDILSVTATTKDDDAQTTEPAVNTVGKTLFKIESNEAVDGYYWTAIGY